MKYMFVVIIIPLTLFLLAFAAGLGYFSEDLFKFFSKMTVVVTIATVVMYYVFHQNFDNEVEDDEKI